MKRDNKLVKFTIFVLLITIVAISLVSGTFAKYATTATGSDTAVVAKWDVSAGNVETTVDIFGESKIYDTYGIGEDNDVTALNVVADGDVKTATTGENGIIAPGTWGNFSYVLTNKSDVNATCSIVYTVENAGVPLKWSTDGKTWTDDLTDVQTTEIAMTNGEKTIDIYWMWEFEGDHTSLGTADTLATPTIQIAVTFEQAD